MRQVTQRFSMHLSFVLCAILFFALGAFAGAIGAAHWWLARKKLLEDVIAQHERDKTARMKLEEKEMRRYVS